jgi:hypothetical protein
MKNAPSSAFIFFVAIFLYSPCCSGQAPLPAADLRTIDAAIQQHFGWIDEIRTIGMTDDHNGRFDVIVVGSSSRRDYGWRVEVFSVSHHKLTLKWDSEIMAREIEYEASGPKSVTIKIGEGDYDLLIEACAPHLCYDGISGFVLFSGKSIKTSKAKVVAQDLEGPFTPTPKYDVTFSKNISTASRQVLEDAICNSRTIGNKAGLPFECKKP